MWAPGPALAGHGSRPRVGWAGGQALCSQRAERGRGSKLPGPRRTSTSSAEMPGPGPPFLEPLGTRGVWGGMQRPPLSGHSLHSGRQRCPGCTSRLQPRTLRCTSLRKCCQLGRSAPTPSPGHTEHRPGVQGYPRLRPVGLTVVPARCGDKEVRGAPALKVDSDPTGSLRGERLGAPTSPHRHPLPCRAERGPAPH